MVPPDDTWAVLQAYAAQHGDPRIRLLTQANAGLHATPEPGPGNGPDPLSRDPEFG